MIFSKIPFLLFLLTSFPFELLAQNENHINYTIDDGLPSNMVYCVQQDEQGFLWFGTDAGLSKYDGYEFTNYTLKDGLPDIEILHFFKDSQSRIWFYTLNGKVGFLKNDSIYSSKNTDWLLPFDFDSRITQIMENDSKIYFSSIDSQIKVLNRTNLTEIELGEINRENSVCFCNNELLVLSNHGFFVLKEDLTTKKKITIENRGLVYPFCYENKIYTFDRSTKEHGITQITDDSLKHFRMPAENYILNFEEHNGKLYLFQRNGISIVDEKNMNLTLYSSAFKSVSSMLIDREGNSWFTSIEKGVFFKPQTEIELKLDVRYATALETRNNQLLVAHDKQYITSVNEQGEHSISRSFKDVNRVNLLYNDSSNNLWVVRNDKLFLNDAELTSFGGFSLVNVKDTYFITGRSSATLGKNRVGSPTKKYRFSSYGLSSALIGNDSILIGTDNGLMLFNQDTIIEYARSPLLKSRITNLVFDTEKNLWIATGGKGLLKYNNGAPVQISKKDGLISDIIDKLLITDDSVIWVSTPQGINKVVVNKNGVKIHWLDGSNGLKSYKINDLILYHEDIYLATNDGLFSFPKDIDLTEPNDFRLFIDKVLVDNMYTTLREFHHDIQSLQLNFKALTFRNHNSLTYQYQLLQNEAAPSNDKWIDTEINHVNFSRIEPSNYHFYVRAKTKNSQWTQPVLYRFEIVPAFWQTNWFLILIAFSLTCSSIGYIYQYNNRKIAKKNLEKAKISAELTALKAQINPHFLFNVLNSIQSFILENEKEIAQEYLVKYGRLMRMVLDDSEQLIVPLESELKMLSLYTDLEKLRLKNGFDFEIIISDYFTSKRVLIPSMIIQPFIENAIWHGLSSLDTKGKITLKVNHDQDHIQVLIMDDGSGFDQTSKKESSHISSGVRLVRERLNLIHDPSLFKSKLEIKSELGKGTTIAILFSDNLTAENT